MFSDEKVIFAFSMLCQPSLFYGLIVLDIFAETAFGNLVQFSTQNIVEVLVTHLLFAQYFKGLRVLRLQNAS